MKGAIEFLKKHGINDAKQLVSMGSGICEIDDGILFHTSDLKRLVESHDLIKSFGGLDLARKEAHKNCFDFNAPLLKAILDVESCQ